MRCAKLTCVTAIYCAILQVEAEALKFLLRSHKRISFEKSADGLRMRIANTMPAGVTSLRQTLADSAARLFVKWYASQFISLIVRR